MNKTALYKMTYRAIEPVVDTYFSKREVVEDKGEMNEETKVMFVASFMQSLNRSFSFLFILSWIHRNPKQTSLILP